MQPLVYLDMLQHRHVEQVAQTRLVMAIEVGVFEHQRVGLAGHVDVPLENHAVLGQGASLVGAEHVHRPHVLHRRQPLDDDFAPRHRQRALGQIDGRQHRQHLRRQSHRDGNREQRRLEPVALDHAIDDEHRWHHHRHKANHQAGKALKPQVEGGLFTLAGGLVGDVTKEGRRTSAQHHAVSSTRHHVAPHEAQVLQVESTVRRSVGDGRMLVSR